MATFHLGVWNVQWMNDLFTSATPTEFKPDDNSARGPRSGSTVIRRRRALSGVLAQLDLDVLIIVEGPNRTEELQLFFDTDVEGDWVCDVQPTKGGSQIIGMAVRTDRGVFQDPPFVRFDTRTTVNDNILSRAISPFTFDTDEDGILEQHHFERNPIFAELRLADDTRVHVVGVHLKSKVVTNIAEWGRWWAIADANRKKILAQARQLRKNYVDIHLKNPETRSIPLIICGDINDGPGFDASERRLDASGVETLMGTIWKPDLCLGNAMFDALDEEDRDDVKLSVLSTTRFRDPIFNYAHHEVWIDHIMYSRNQPHQWVTEGKIHERLPDNNLIWQEFPYASDHYPVSAVINTTPPN